MKLATLFVSNFIGAAAVDLRLDAPVQLFCGRNGAGKSSIRDAVALALTADLGRVSLKKDAPALITEGADAAVCEVKDADGDAYSVSITRAGKITDSQKGRDPDPTFAFVLDAQRFATLSTTDRRAFLFGLVGAKMDSVAVKERLLKRQCDAARIDRILPMLRSGFEAASKDAKNKATEAKGSWRGLTGETWGSTKGASWKAAAATFDAKALATKITELAEADAAVATAQQHLGALEAETRRRAELQQKLNGLRGKAALLSRAVDKLAVDESTLAELQQRVTSTQQAAGDAPRVGLVHDLAQAVADLIGYADMSSPGFADATAALEAYEREHGAVGSVAGDAAARDALPALLSTLERCQGTVENSKRDRDAAQAAAAEVKVIEDQLADADPLDDIEAARKQQTTLEAARKAVVVEVDRLRSLKTAAEGAEKKTADAAKHHADVIAWDAIGDALGPDGIPAELLAEALGPMNDRLAQTAVDTEWPRIELAADMTIRTGLHERPYALLSESEQWRCDAMLAEAIAHISGIRLLVLDRFDVLDPKGRQDLLAWLDTLADTGEIDTALVFGTLKAAPTNLPPTIAAHWIENGVVGGQLKEAA